jgi:hypothetical protein
VEREGDQAFDLPQQNAFALSFFAAVPQSVTCGESHAIPNAPISKASDARYCIFKSQLNR